jgi:uridine kinase
MLEATLFNTIYLLYKFGVRSNALYKKEHNLVISISGDSGAGKSTYVQDLQALLGKNATIIEGDGDHKWERGHAQWKTVTHLNPKANFLHRQVDDILALKMGKSIYRTHYNHHTGTFDKPELTKPTDFIIINGLHSLYLPKMRKITDIKIFLNPDHTIRYHWKMMRDLHERGYSKEKVLEHLNKRMHDTEKFIEPQKQFSDVIITYFCEHPIDVGNPDIKPDIELNITLDSSIKLESLVAVLIQEQIEHEWNYADDLKTQYVILKKPIPAITLLAMSKQIIINIEELCGNHIAWADGYRGFVQLISLLIISEKLKESDLL